MVSSYDRYPAVDREFNFPPEVRQALANSVDLATAMGQVLPPLLDAALADDPDIRDDLVAKISALTAADLDLIRRGDPGIPIISDYDGFLWLVLDSTNRMALGITDDGTVRAIRFSSDKIELEGVSEQYFVAEGEHSWAVVDKDGRLSELRIDPSGRVPDDVLLGWSDRMNWSSDDVQEAIEDALAGYQPGLERGSAERAADYSTTVTAAGTMIPGLTLNITGGGRPVDIECRIPNAFHSVANTGVNMLLYLNGDVIQVGTVYSPKTTKGPVLSVKQRAVLEDGEDYVITVDFWGDAAGTSSMDVSAGAPAYLTVTNR